MAVTQGKVRTHEIVLMANQDQGGQPAVTTIQSIWQHPTAGQTAAISSYQAGRVDGSSALDPDCSRCCAFGKRTRCGKRSCLVCSSQASVMKTRSPTTGVTRRDGIGLASEPRGNLVLREWRRGKFLCHRLGSLRLSITPIRNPRTLNLPLHVTQATCGERVQHQRQIQRTPAGSFWAGAKEKKKKNGR